MRILHTYCLNFNIGDYALGIGVKNLLRNYLPVSSIGETNLQGTVFNEYFIEEVVNKKYDLLVIGGGGIIHGAHWPNGWFWLIDQDLIQRIRIPFIVYGVGYNYFKGEQGMPPHGIEHLKETIGRAAYFAVRNDGSRERLESQTGIVAPEIPDPGFHVGLNTRYDSPMDRPYVVVQLANDKPEYRFGGAAQKDRFVAEMRRVVAYLGRRYEVVLAPHVLEDVALSQEVAEGIAGASVWDFGYFAFDHSDKALAYYQKAEFVLAMRGHGQIVPIGFNVPVISLENHDKNRGLMEKLDLLDYNIDIRDPQLADKLISLTEAVASDREALVARYRQINTELDRNSAAAFEAIRAALQPVAAPLA